MIRENTGRLFTNVITGVLIGFIEVILAISLGSLLFSGEMTAYLSRGIGIVLVTAIVNLIITSLLSATSGVVSSSQDGVTVLLAALIGSFEGVLAGEDLLATVLVSIALTTILTGIFLIALGHFNLGRLVRYMPYPVIGGFLAGTGLLLVKGAIEMMAGLPLGIDTISDFMESDQLVVWGSGVGLGLAFFLGLRRTKHALALPGLLLAGFAVFFAALLLTGTSIDQATEQGLLLGEFSDNATWLPFDPHHLIETDWRSVMGRAGDIGTILLLTAVSLLLNVSGIELAVGKDMELNREMKSAGIANIISGLSGGAIGFHALSLTVFGYRVGARGRYPAIIAGVICVIFFFAGSDLLAYAPVPLLGGLLVLLGLDFLDEWVFQGYRKFDRLDFAVVLVIVLVIAAAGFLVGVGVGLVIMIGLFVVEYSGTDIFHHAWSGAEITSNVRRNAHYERALRRLGERIFVLELEGFIFFGTAHALLHQIRQRLQSPDQERLCYLVLDFKRVSGLDSTAVLSFERVKQLADSNNFAVVLTHLDERLNHGARLAAIFPDGENTTLFPDLDHGLEWCENRVLEDDEVTQAHIPSSLLIQLTDAGFEKAQVRRLQGYLERMILCPGDYLIHQGSKADEMYFIEIGTVSVYHEFDDEQNIRLKRLGMGTIVGELGFYLNTEQSASVISDDNTIVYRLTREALEEMKTADPDLALVFNELMLRVVSEHLVAANRALAALSR